MTDSISKRAIDESLTRLQDTIIDWVSELVRTPSVTGSEHDAQLLVSDILVSIGLTPQTIVPTESIRSHPSFSDDELPVDRPVILATVKGSQEGAPSVIFNGHIDVVPTGDEDLFPHGPWSAKVVDGELWGRGACDMKGGLVSAIAGIAVLADLGIAPPGDVTIESVTGEETGGVGTLATVIAGHSADAAIIFEPTSLNICPVGAGSASFRLLVPGLAAHGARRRHGVSSIEKFSYLASELSAYEAKRDESFSHEVYDPEELVAPISIGKVCAGDWPSTVPDHLVAEGRAGVLPGESLAQARAEFEEVVAKAASRDSWLASHPPTVEWFEGQFEPASTPIDCALVKHLSGIHEERLALAPRIRGVTYGSDLRFFTNDASMPAVLYGPGNVDLAHTVQERIKIEELLTAAGTAAQFAATWGLT